MNALDQEIGHEYTRVGEECEHCGRRAKVGDRVAVFAIGGGWAHLCAECYADHEADRQTGQILTDPSLVPEMLPALVVERDRPVSAVPPSGRA